MESLNNPENETWLVYGAKKSNEALLWHEKFNKFISMSNICLFFPC